MFLLFIIGAFLSACLAVPAAAQYPPSPDPPFPRTPKPQKTPKPKCATTGTLIGGGLGSDEERFRPQRDFERGETVAVKGERGCVKPNGRVTLHIGRGEGLRQLGDTASTADGAFLVSGQILGDARYRMHHLRVSSLGATYRTTIHVVPDAGSRRSVMTVSLLAVWFTLAGIVGAYVIGTRRRRPVVASAEPSLEVPRIDTMNFVPVLPERRRFGRSAEKAEDAQAPVAAPSPPTPRKAKQDKPKPKAVARKVAPQKGARKAASTPTAKRKPTRPKRKPKKPKRPKKKGDPGA